LALWSAQAISQTAQNAISFTLLVEIERLTHSSTYVSLVLLSFIVPAVVFSALAGVLVDRVNKKVVLVSTNALRIFAVAGYLVIGETWPLPLLLLSFYLVTLIFSSVSQFFGPAEAAVIPELVGRERLIDANALFNLTYTLAQLAGFAVLGPVVVKLTGTRAVFAAVAFLYLVCTLLVSTIPSREPVLLEAPARKRGRLEAVVADLREGLAFIRSDRPVAISISHLTVSSAIFLMVGTLGTGYVTRVLGIASSDLGFLMAPAGVGILVGIGTVSRYGRHRKEAWVNFSLVAVGITVLLLGLLPVIYDLTGIQGSGRSGLLPWVMVLAVMLGIESAFISIPAQTILQERAPDQMRGRVFSVLYTLGNAAAIFPIFIAGTLADLVGVVATLLLVGVLVLVVSAVGLQQGRTSTHASTH
jgi:MFS family permease